MTDKSTNTLIKKIEEEFTDLPKGRLTEDVDFKNVLNWNSINSVVLATMIEFEYGVLLTADDLNNTSSIKDLQLLIKLKSEVDGTP